jgi:hypothetical protein
MVVGTISDQSLKALYEAVAVGFSERRQTIVSPSESICL